MAFNSNPGRAEYTAVGGQTVFPFVFKIFLTSDIKVYQTPDGQTPNDIADLLILGVDYTVSIDGDNGGEMTLNSGATLNDSITNVRELSINRLIEYQTNGDLLAGTINEDQDYQTYLIADQQTISERTMVLSESAQGVSSEMPPVVSQQFLRWNVAGDALENAQAVIQEITEFNDTNFRLISTGNKKLIYDLAAFTADRTWTAPDKSGTIAMLDDIPSEIAIDTTATAQTKIGDLTIGETVSVSSWSYVGTTITVNTSAIHNLSVGQYFSVSGLVATTNAPNGRWEVATVVDTDTITFTADDTPTGTPTVSSAELSHGLLKANDALQIKDAVLAPTGLAPIYPIRAWIDFNGTGTVAIRKSGNISSIADNGLGNYTASFIIAMPDEDYIILGPSSRESGQAQPRQLVYAGGTKTTSAIQVLSEVDTGTNFDMTFAYVAIIR